MKTLLKLFSLFILPLCSLTATFAQVLPTFNLEVRNFHYGDTLNGSNNVLFFDVNILHTNLSQSGPFELSLNTFHWNFNPGIANGGILSFKKILNSSNYTNPNQSPRNPTVNMSTGVLSLLAGSVVGAGNGSIISTISPGSRAVTLRLATNAGSFSNAPLSLVWRRTTSNPITKIFAYLGTTSTDISSNGTYTIDSAGLVFPSARIKLNLTAIVEGLYFPLFNSLSRRDPVTVDLRETVSPFNLISTTTVIIDSTNFTAYVTFPASPGTYYIVLKHFNSIETWSKAGGVTFPDTETPVNYNFTTSNAQAYGNNLKLKGGKYCLYSADVNQDGYIDASDASLIDNDVFTTSIGSYMDTDLNGDNVADAGDLQIWDNNRRHIGVISPMNSLQPNRFALNE